MFESVCMCDLQHSKQLLVPSNSPSDIDINGDISANAIRIARRVLLENALVESLVRDGQSCSCNMVYIYDNQLVFRLSLSLELSQFSAS